MNRFPNFLVSFSICFDEPLFDAEVGPFELADVDAIIIHAKALSNQGDIIRWDSCTECCNHRTMMQFADELADLPVHRAKFVAPFS